MLQLYVSLSTTSAPSKSKTLLCNQPADISLSQSGVLLRFPTVKSVMQGSALAPSMNTDSVYTLWQFWDVCPHLSLLNCLVSKFLFHFIHYPDQCGIFSQLFLLLKEYNQIYILKVTRQDEAYANVSPSFSSLLPTLRPVYVSFLKFLKQLDFVENLPKYLFIISETVLLWIARLSPHSVLQCEDMIESLKVNVSYIFIRHFTQNLLDINCNISLSCSYICCILISS